MNNDLHVNKYFLKHDRYITGLFYKILPMYEENNDTLYEYVSSLIFEFEGLAIRIKELEDIPYYERLMDVLERLQDEMIIIIPENKPYIKREVNKCIDFVKKIKDELVKYNELS